MSPEIATRETLIARTYLSLHEQVTSYIRARINDNDAVEDLAQDVWCRLLEVENDLIGETIQGLVYKMSHAVVMDYLRRLYTRRKSKGSMAEADYERYATDYTPEEELIASDLAAAEQARVAALPQQRRVIYTMSRWDGLAPAEIADELDLSVRTVENHLRMGRRDVRNFITAIA